MHTHTNIYISIHTVCKQTVWPDISQWPGMAHFCLEI